MSDLEELKRQKEKPMDTDTPPPTTSTQKTDSSTAAKTDDSDRPIALRSSTPDHSVDQF